MCGDLMRCADPERIAVPLVTAILSGCFRANACGAKVRTRLRACRRERIVNFDG